MEVAYFSLRRQQIEASSIREKEMGEGNIIQPIPQAFRENTKIEKERQKERERDNPLARSRERKRMYKSNKKTNDD